jgi:two-component system sensor histidine kinase AgrC
LAFAVFAFTDSLRKETELKHKDTLMKDLESYTRHVENMATEMRKFRHDHKNLMLVFHTHVESRDWDGLENYYSSYMNEFSTSETAIESCMDKLKNIQTPELKTILFLKFLQVQRKGIKIIIEVENIVTIIGDYNLLDTCRIVGILMDNAMEACQNVDGAVVRLMGDMSGNNAHFAFQNTCYLPPPINQINKKGFTTKDGARGLGLYNVSQLIKKNRNLTLQTKIEKNCFTQELKIAPEISKSRRGSRYA